MNILKPIIKIKFGIALVLILLSTLSAQSQQTTFQKSFYNSTSDDVANAIQNSNGNYVLAGMTYSVANGFDAVITEVSSTGSILQTKTFASTPNEILKSICQTSDGGYFITGSVFTNPSDYNWLLIKLDSSFNTVFYKVYGVTGIDDNANRGFEISPGHYTVVGSLGLGGSVKPSVVTVDTAGLVVQQGYLTTNQFASPRYSGRYLGNGEVGITDLTNAITVLDTAGNVIKQYPNSLGIYSTDIIKTSTNNYACVSIANYGAPTGSTLSIGIVDNSLTTYLNGNSFKVSGKDIVPTGLLEDSSGNFLIAGYSYDFNADIYLPLLIKTTSTGTLIWCKNYKPSTVSSAKFNSIVSTNDGGYLLAGTSGPWNNQKMYLVKVDSSGNSCSNAAYTVTPQAITPQASTLHLPYTGSVSALSPASTLSPVLTLSVSSYCISTEVVQIAKNKSLSVSPNCFTDGFKINCDSQELMTVNIFDINGRIVMSTHAHNGEWINANSLESGCYIIRVAGNSTKNNLTAKILKM